MADWNLYIVHCADGSLYTGITTDVERRLREHNRGVGAKYTRARRPVELAYEEAHPDHSSAARREAAVKKMRRAAKLKLIEE